MLCDYTGYQVSSWAELLTSHSGYVVDRCPLNLEDRGSIPPKVVTTNAVGDGEGNNNLVSLAGSCNPATWGAMKTCANLSKAVRDRQCPY